MTTESRDTAEEIDPRILELLVCPLTKTRLEYDAARQELVSRAAALAFPIKNEIGRASCRERV